MKPWRDRQSGFCGTDAMLSSGRSAGPSLDHDGARDRFNPAVHLLGTIDLHIESSQ